ncbi:MAG: hypothetical protein V1808_00430 [Candidatus Daviesbacteria bacterium]
MSFKGAYTNINFMTGDELNQIRGVVKEEINSALKPIEKRTEGIEEQLNDPDTGLRKINEKLDALWDQTAGLTEDVTEIKESIKSQTSTLNQTNGNLEKIDKRLTKVENHLGIVPSPELTMVR